MPDIITQIQNFTVDFSALAGGAVTVPHPLMGMSR